MTSPHQVTKDFERALCAYTGAPYAVTTTSCTMALLLVCAWHIRERFTKWWRYNWWVDGPDERPTIQIPKRTYIGVPYAIREAGGRPAFRDEDWCGAYQMKPLPVWDSARRFTGGMYLGMQGTGAMLCVSFHWSKTLGIQQGGAILHDDYEADQWLRRARFDGRTEGIPPSMDTFPLPRAWHAYMSPEVAAEGLMRLSYLPKHNEPLPWGPGTSSDYGDLSQLEVFK